MAILGRAAKNSLRGTPPLSFLDCSYLPPPHLFLFFPTFPLSFFLSVSTSPRLFLSVPNFPSPSVFSCLFLLSNPSPPFFLSVPTSPLPHLFLSVPTSPLPHLFLFFPTFPLPPFSFFPVFCYLSQWNRSGISAGGS